MSTAPSNNKKNGRPIKTISTQEAAFICDLSRPKFMQQATQRGLVNHGTLTKAAWHVAEVRGLAATLKREARQAKAVASKKGS